LDWTLAHKWPMMRQKEGRFLQVESQQWQRFWNGHVLISRDLTNSWKQLGDSKPGESGVQSIAVKQATGTRLLELQNQQALQIMLAAGCSAGRQCVACISTVWPSDEMRTWNTVWQEEHKSVQMKWVLWLWLYPYLSRYSILIWHTRILHRVTASWSYSLSKHTPYNELTNNTLCGTSLRI
jgi:hypothetical protein